jgi:signal transduction histidine kinase
VLVVLAILAALFKLRVRQISNEIRGRLEARLAERERIARDLHDTLLQGVQGLIWRFQAAADRIPPDQPARQLMQRSLDRADQLLAESRERVKDLRYSAGNVDDLPRALALEGEQFSQEYSTGFRVSIEGGPRELHPLVREEGFLIAREALANAFRHAHATHVEAEIGFGHTTLHIRVRDDGKGMSTAGADRGELPGHFGLIGMQERAQKIGANFEVWSRPGAGTEVELRVPAAIAYRPAQVSSLRGPAWFDVLHSLVRRH